MDLGWFQWAYHKEMSSFDISIQGFQFFMRKYSSNTRNLHHAIGNQKLRHQHHHAIFITATTIITKKRNSIESQHEKKFHQSPLAIYFNSFLNRIQKKDKILNKNRVNKIYKFLQMKNYFFHSDSERTLNLVFISTKIVNKEKSQTHHQCTVAVHHRAVSN